MKRKYICIPVMVLMICALFPGMMISGDCESCSTEDVTPYTSQYLRESSLETDEMLDTLFQNISKKTELLTEMLKNVPSKEDEELSSLIDDFYTDYIYYLHYNYQKATLETVSAMTSESNNYLLINEIDKQIERSELEMAFLQYENLTREVDAQYDILRLYYAPTEDTQVEYGVVFDNILFLYKELTNLNTRYARLMTEYNISLQAEKQEILMRSLVICDTPGTGDSLQSYQQYYMASFAWVKAWVGVYSSQVPNTDYFIGEFCTGTKNTLDGYLAIANDEYDPWNVGSIQVKYFFIANQSTHQHNAIYEGNRSNYNLNGNYSIGGRQVSFTNGTGWTYGVSYDGSSTPSNGNYRFYVNADWFITYQACCIPSWPPDNTIYPQWCNKHCGGCFACDDGADQNFIIDEP